MSVAGALYTIMLPLSFLPVYIQRCRLSQHNRFSLPAFIHCLYVAVEFALFVDWREVESRVYAFLGWQRQGARCGAAPPLTKQHLLVSCAAPLNQPCLFNAIAYSFRRHPVGTPPSFCSSSLHVSVQCFSPIVTGSLPASIHSSCTSRLGCSAGRWVAIRGLWVRLFGLAAGCGALLHMRCFAHCDDFTAREHQS